MYKRHQILTALLQSENICQKTHDFIQSYIIKGLHTCIFYVAVHVNDQELSRKKHQIMTNRQYYKVLLLCT